MHCFKLKLVLNFHLGFNLCLIVVEKFKKKNPLKRAHNSGRKLEQIKTFISLKLLNNKNNKIKRKAFTIKLKKTW